MDKSYIIGICASVWYLKKNDTHVWTRDPGTLKYIISEYIV